MNTENELPQARVETARGLSLVWIIPLVAALAGGWLVYKSYSEVGPEITIRFQRGDGIEADKTTLRFKAVEVGHVTAVRISDDSTSVLVTALIDKHFAPKLRENTRFWVVRPRVGASGISGLGTLVSGAYIEIDPGEGGSTHSFVALEAPPIVAADVAGRRFVLEATKLGSIQAGSGIFFRDIQVGEALGYELDQTGARVTIHIFIRDPYTKLVRDGTIFANASGINVSVNADGIELRTSSLQTMLGGGITFDLPLGVKGEQAAAGAVFRLFDGPEGVSDANFTEQVPFVLYFEDSVRGLSVGAPVEFKGIKLGSVTQIDLEVDGKNADILIPVTIALQPQRFASNAFDRIEHPHGIMDALIARGLRARLQTGSLLTGQMFVELGFYPETEKVMVTGRRAIAQIPTIPSEFVEIKHSATELLDKLRKLPLESLGERSVSIMQEVEALVKSPRIPAMLDNANASLESIRALSASLDAEIKPLTMKLNETLDGVGEDSAVHAQLRMTLKQLSDAARAVRDLAETVERQPNAIIFGKKKARAVGNDD